VQHRDAATLAVGLPRLLLLDQPLRFTLAQLPLHLGERIVSRRDRGIERGRHRQPERHEGRRRQHRARRIELRQQRIEIEELFNRGRRRRRDLGRPRVRLHGLRDVIDGLREVGVGLRELQRAAVVHQRLAHHPAALVNLGQRANRWQVARRGVEHGGQLGEGVIELVELDEGAAEGDPCRQIVWMVDEAGAADANGFVVVADPPAFLGELFKSDRRRVCLDPASKIENTRVVVHTAISVTARTSTESDRYGVSTVTL
jgi:hypothetical protein